MDQQTKLCDNDGKNVTINLKHMEIRNNSEIYDAIPKQAKNPTSKQKSKRRNKSDLGDNFVAPDGGWGWLVAIATGLNMMVTFAAAHQFGIIFRDHLVDLKISSSQLTTIINTQIAVSGVTGIINGPLFRRFSYRQVSLIGCTLSFAGLFACAFANSFLFFIFAFSFCYGFGRSFIISASTMAINTFFKEKRRSAASLRFGVAGLGPIVFPYLASYLMSSIGMRYTMFCFAALSLNAVAGSLIFQPARWHMKTPLQDIRALEKLNTEDSKFLEETKIELNGHENGLTNKSAHHLKPGYNGNEYHENPALKEEKSQVKSNKSCFKSVVSFLDLDLLRDMSFLNLLIGLTLANFVEVNFVILTPFILSDFGYALPQIALAMSLMGFSDLIIRFLVPVITSKLKLSNKIFFTIGILGMCLGRFLLSVTDDFYTMIGIFLWMGFSKAFRTVFWSLIIPEYVPLKRLPAASGIQRLMAGLFSLACGPFIGLIRDKSANYAVTLNCLNVLCIMALSMWFLEYLMLKYFRKPIAERKSITLVNGSNCI
ncbi:monocarboxylate transporter 6-like [Haematobia irritans]|uniref:monocarboxylate transporter 6-like n=1 Tax=Haematobia irritans TaxID=7368 RepID=UPI003F500F03